MSRQDDQAAACLHRASTTGSLVRELSASGTSGAMPTPALAQPGTATAGLVQAAGTPSTAPSCGLPALRVPALRLDTILPGSLGSPEANAMQSPALRGDAATSLLARRMASLPAIDANSAHSSCSASPQRPGSGRSRRDGNATVSGMLDPLAGTPKPTEDPPPPMSAPDASPLDQCDRASEPSSSATASPSFRRTPSRVNIALRIMRLTDDCPSPLSSPPGSRRVGSVSGNGSGASGVSTLQMVPSPPDRPRAHTTCHGARSGSPLLSRLTSLPSPSSPNGLDTAASPTAATATKLRHVTKKSTSAPSSAGPQEVPVPLPQSPNRSSRSPTRSAAAEPACAAVQPSVTFAVPGRKAEPLAEAGPVCENARASAENGGSQPAEERTLEQQLPDLQQAQEPNMPQRRTSMFGGLTRLRFDARAVHKSIFEGGGKLLGWSPPAPDPESDPRSCWPASPPWSPARSAMRSTGDSVALLSHRTPSPDPMPTRASQQPASLSWCPAVFNLGSGFRPASGACHDMGEEGLTDGTFMRSRSGSLQRPDGCRQLSRSRSVAAGGASALEPCRRDRVEALLSALSHGNGGPTRQCHNSLHQPRTGPAELQRVAPLPPPPRSPPTAAQAAPAPGSSGQAGQGNLRQLPVVAQMLAMSVTAEEQQQERCASPARSRVQSSATAGVGSGDSWTDEYERSRLRAHLIIGSAQGLALQYDEHIRAIGSVQGYMEQQRGPEAEE